MTFPRSDLEITDEWINTYNEFVGPISVHDNTSLLLRPDALSFDYKTAYSFGPIAIGDASSGLVATLWRLRYYAGTLYLAKKTTTDWVNEIVLVNAPSTLEEIDLAFDQNGRPVVTWSNNGNIYLYWHDPVVSGFVTSLFAVGRTPRVSLDNPIDVSNSDINLFYINDVANNIVYRQQRDRYLVEYPTPVVDVVNKYLERVAPTRNFRVEVVYSQRWPALGKYTIGRLVSKLLPVPVEAESLDLYHATIAAANRTTTWLVDQSEYIDLDHSTVYAFNFPLVIPYSMSVEGLDLDHSTVSAILRALVISYPAEVEKLDLDHATVSAILKAVLSDDMEVESLDLDHVTVTATNAP